MVFQHCGYMSNPYKASNTGCGGAVLVDGQANAKKRKELDSEMNTADYDHASPPRPKLSLPRSAGLIFNGDSQFHPLPPEVNHAILAQLDSNNLFSPTSRGSVAQSSPASTVAGMTPSSSLSTGCAADNRPSGGLDYFGRYPAVEPYPSSPTSQRCGILGPAPGEVPANSMQIDGGDTAQGHGPHCRSIPQLCVRYNDGTSSDLWATCPDCGACSKVESSQPSSNLCYSP